MNWDGEELGAARVARLREALEEIHGIIKRAEPATFVVENGPTVVAVGYLEGIEAIVREALSDDSLTRDRPTPKDIIAAQSASVVIDRRLRGGTICL